MLRELVAAGRHFAEQGEMVPAGYKLFSKQSPIKWILHLDEEGRLIGEPEEVEIVHKPRPGRRRSGKPAPGNLKPYLLVDEARYVLGIPEPGKEAEAELLHQGFLELLSKAYEQTGEPYLNAIYRYLSEFLDRKELSQKIAPKDVVTFAVEDPPYPFERREMQEFWLEFIGEECSSQFQGTCSVCGEHRTLLQTLPKEVFILSQGCQISSFNQTAFTSFGKAQTTNANICVRCGIIAAQTLEHLLKHEQYNTILVRYDKKGDGQNPLRNQVAVYWLKEPVGTIAVKEQEVSLLELLSAPLTYQTEEPGAVPTLQLLEEFLKVPWTGKEGVTHAPENAFYLAVLSANKARLVVREWISVSLEGVQNRLKTYLQALRIVDAKGSGIRAFPIPALVSTLKDPDPNLVRGLLRTAYLGQPVPTGLLEAAVRRMRSLVHQNQRGGGDPALQILASVVKLALTYGRQEAKTMEKLDERSSKPAYLSGRLLAVLEEIQLRAAKWRLNTTLVDRFYGAASTSPATVFPTLIKMAETGHLPKIRKEGLGYRKMKDTLQEICARLDEAGGFPSILTLKEQGDFALGFYHQRAALAAERENGEEKSAQNI